jgi:three-Cys-motif partner protein
MSSGQKFGGQWTIEKLSILSDYLDAYQTALKNQSFRKIYIDAFAGTGDIIVGNDHIKIEGSVRLALNAKIPFDHYCFIEKKKSFSTELKRIIGAEYSDQKNRTNVINEDCNTALVHLCNTIDWMNNRALLFLDPYATEVKWSTLLAVAETKAIDVWYLFPYNAAVRMLTNDGKMDISWQNRLNDIFGESKWFDEFYRPDPQISLFGNNDGYIKDINKDTLKEYICNRLKTIFPAVAENPRILYNTKNSPLFLFCFAVSNDKQSAIDLALRIANHILNKKITDLN